VDCNNTGYKGRCGVYEVFPLSAIIRDQILDRASTAAIKKQIQSLTTPGVKVTVEVLGSAPPVTCGVDNPVAKALRAAYSEAFGRDTALIRVGGSIPVSIDFQEAVGAPLVISGIGEADAAAHSPNERLSVDQYHRGIEAIIRFICKLGE